MKVHGNYYKNTTTRGKVKENFELEVKEGGLLEMRKEAAERLRATDREFRGLREFFVETLDGEKEIPSTEPTLSVAIPSDDVIRQKAKELGIKNWHNKKIDNLIKEIKALERIENDK